jgi:hypothetical protein
MWLPWVAVDCRFGLALLLCTHFMDLQLAGMIFRRAAMLSPLSHARRRLPQALAAQRLHGQMAGPNSRAAGAESSRSMVPASMVRVDVPAGSIAHAHAPQSDRTAHSACAALIALCPTDGWTAISTLNAQAYGCFDLAEPTRAREVGARAKTSTAAAGARLYGLVIRMPHTWYR